jgi:hypothetical protein
MARSRALCVRSAALIVPLALLVVSEAPIGPALADPPNAKSGQPNNHGPRAQNDAAGPKKGPKPAPADPNVLSMELKALRILRGLEATPHQIVEIGRAAKKTAGKPGQRESAKVSDPYVEAMVQMRRALVGNDTDKIEQLRTQFDQLEEKSPPDLDDQIEITDGAEIEAVRLLNIFTPQQVIAYAQSLEDDFPDPVQLIREGLEEGRSLKNAEWETARNKLTEEVGWVVCGSQGDKATKLEEQVSAFLDQKHGQAPAGIREAEIRQLVGSPGPVVILKNVMEHTLADLLSNPQVYRAAGDCLRHDKPPEPPAAKPVAQAPAAPKGAPKRPQHPPTKTGETAAKRIELDEVLKAPDQFDGQELRFDHVSVTATAPGKSPNNLWLAVKTQSGTVVAASRDQKLTFVIPIAKTPEVIKELKSGGGAEISVTLTCTVHRDAPKHWNARVLSVEVH